MPTKAQIEAYIREAVAHRKGDNLERARASFRNLTPAQMQEQFGLSCQTRQQILDCYLADRALHRAAEDYLETLLNA